MTSASMRLSDLINALTPIMTTQGTAPERDREREQHEWRANVMKSRLAKAGLFGEYVQADSQEGCNVYARFTDGKGTYLYGNPGTGKTYAAACCVRLAAESGLKAKLITAPKLLESIKEGYGTGDKQVLSRACNYDLLALDDLGMERPTEWGMETLSLIIDERCKRNKPTVITSNYSLGELAKRWGGMEGKRLVSRLAGSCERVALTGDDLRLRGQ